MPTGSGVESSGSAAAAVVVVVAFLSMVKKMRTLKSAFLR